LQRPRQDDLLISRCKGGAKNSGRSTLVYGYIAARNSRRGLSALNSAFAKGEISSIRFHFCERKTLTIPSLSSFDAFSHVSVSAQLISAINLADI